MCSHILTYISGSDDEVSYGEENDTQGNFQIQMKHLKIQKNSFFIVFINRQKNIFKGEYIPFGLH